MRPLASAVLAFVLAACSTEESRPAGGDGGASPSGTTDGGGTTDAGAGAGDAGAATAATDAGDAGAPDDASPPAGPFTLTSAAFVEGGVIPLANAKCPNAAGNASPPLAWTNAPAGTQSFAIVMRDTSLAQANNYHWVIYDIPASVTSLAAGVPAVAAPGTPAGAKQTFWSFSSDYSYQGPCPPSEHTYQFTVYALPTATLAVASTTSPATADAAIQAAKIGSASLTGKYAQ